MPRRVQEPIPGRCDFRSSPEQGCQDFGESPGPRPGRISVRWRWSIRQSTASERLNFAKRSLCERGDVQPGNPVALRSRGLPWLRAEGNARAGRPRGVDGGRVSTDDRRRNFSPDRPAQGEAVGGFEGSCLGPMAERMRAAQSPRPTGLRAGFSWLACTAAQKCLSERERRRRCLSSADTKRFALGRDGGGRGLRRAQGPARDLRGERGFCLTLKLF